MDDFRESAYLYIIGGAVILFVLAQSVFFLMRAVRRGKQLGISAKAMKQAAVSSGTFSILPSVPIVLAMITLAYTIGNPLSWIRLSVIGSMTYETTAAKAVVDAAKAVSADPNTFVMTQDIFASIMWIMTIGILAGPIFNLFGFKKYQAKLAEISRNDSRWSTTFSDAMFMGIIVRRAVHRKGHCGVRRPCGCRSNGKRAGAAFDAADKRGADADIRRGHQADQSEMAREFCAAGFDGGSDTDLGCLPHAVYGRDVTWQINKG